MFSLAIWRFTVSGLLAWSLWIPLASPSGTSSISLVTLLPLAIPLHAVFSMHVGRGLWRSTLWFLRSRLIGCFLAPSVLHPFGAHIFAITATNTVIIVGSRNYHPALRTGRDSFPSSGSPSRILYKILAIIIFKQRNQP